MYKLNQKGIEVRKNLDDHSVYQDYILMYEKEIRSRGEKPSDYCIPFTKAEFKLLNDGGGCYLPNEDGTYTIDDGLIIGIED